MPQKAGNVVVAKKSASRENFEVDGPDTQFDTRVGGNLAKGARLDVPPKVHSSKRSWNNTRFTEAFAKIGVIQGPLTFTSKLLTTVTAWAGSTN